MNAQRLPSHLPLLILPNQRVVLPGARISIAVSRKHVQPLAKLLSDAEEDDKGNPLLLVAAVPVLAANRDTGKQQGNVIDVVSSWACCQ